MEMPPPAQLPAAPAGRQARTGKPAFRRSWNVDYRDADRQGRSRMRFAFALSLVVVASVRGATAAEANAPSCPSDSQVDAALARLGVAPGLQPAISFERGRMLVLLRGRGGAMMGTREVDAPTDCQERAEVVAVLVASWMGVWPEGSRADDAPQVPSGPPPVTVAPAPAALPVPSAQEERPVILPRQGQRRHCQHQPLPQRSRSFRQPRRRCPSQARRPRRLAERRNWDWLFWASTMATHRPWRRRSTSGCPSPAASAASLGCRAPLSGTAAWERGWAATPFQSSSLDPCWGLNVAACVASWDFPLGLACSSCRARICHRRMLPSA